MHKSVMLRMVMAAVVMVLIGASAFASGVEIVHYHDSTHGPLWLQWLEESAERFEKENPGVTVTILVSAGRTDHQEKMMAMHATDTLPDVIEVFAGSYYPFVLYDVFQTLDGLMEQDPALSWNEFFPAANAAALIAEGHPGEGSHWFLPASMWTVGYIFNHDAFNEGGVQIPSMMEHHWTWEDAHDIARKLTKLNPDGTFLQYGIDLNPVLSRSLVWFHNADAFPFNSVHNPTESRLNTTAVRDTLEFLHEVWQISQVARVPGRNAAPEIADTGGPDYTSFHRNQGRTYEYSYGPMPKRVRGGSENVTLGFAIGKGSKHPDATWKWLRFLVTEGAEDHTRITGRPVAWGPAARNFASLIPNAMPFENVWIDIVADPDGYERPGWPKEISDVITGMINSVATGEAPPAIAIDAAERQLQSLL